VVADVLHFIEFVLLFALALIALFIVLLIVVSMMPKSNPLKIILMALARRVGVTAGLMVLDPVATAVPAAGEVWDLVTIIWLIYFWYTFFKQLPVMRAAWSNSAENYSPSRPPTTTRRTLPIKTSATNNTQSKLGKRTSSGPPWKPSLPPRS
jgi:hypothetical protein